MATWSAGSGSEACSREVERMLQATPLRVHRKRPATQALGLEIYLWLLNEKSDVVNAVELIVIGPHSVADQARKISEFHVSKFQPDVSDVNVKCPVSKYFHPIRRHGFNVRQLCKRQAFEIIDAECLFQSVELMPK